MVLPIVVTAVLVLAILVGAPTVQRHEAALKSARAKIENS
jgi:hypothetical protein